jgi:hypothetical protein
VAPSATTIAAPLFAPRQGGVHWIISQSSLWRLSEQMSRAELMRLFDNPNTYVITNLKDRGDFLTAAHHVAFYRDEQLMAQDLAAGKLSNVDGVLLDDEAYAEAGNTTPEVQKMNPVPYVQNAAQVLHAAGKIFVLTIGGATGPRGAFWTQTLPAVSPYPDVIDFQTQAAEGTPRFRKQVDHYASVYRTHGGHLMLVGLAISPKGQFRSAQQIRQSYDEAMNARVDGFWFNMAVKSGSCTGCAATLDISPAVEFFRSIENQR